MKPFINLRAIDSMEPEAEMRAMIIMKAMVFVRAIRLGEARKIHACR